MPPISWQEIAKRAGVDPDFVERLAELGILLLDDDGKLAEGDVQLVRIVQTLERAGLPLEGIGEALHRGVISLDFIDTAYNDRWALLSDITYQEMSERSSVPLSY